MRLIAAFGRCAMLVRDFIAPRYHPERYYMRGPGPACGCRRRDRGTHFD
jgi:hypothetical protein